MNFSQETIEWARQMINESKTSEERSFREAYLHNLNYGYAQEKLSENRLKLH